MEKKSAKIHAVVALVVAAVIIAVCFTGISAILLKRDYDTDAPVSSGAVKAMSQNMEMDVLLMMNGVTTKQRMTYDHEEDTVLIETSAGLNGSTTAVIAIDYARELVFIRIADQNVCLGSDLFARVAPRVVAFMRENTEATIDVASTSMERLNYVIEGEIPTGYISSSNGPVVKGLCAGHTSYWTKAATNQNTRIRRQIGSVTVTICLFGTCFSFTINF